MSGEKPDWCILDASIETLLNALSNGSLTSIDLVARYLRRISVYDASGPKLSAVPILNPHAMEEATASDLRRAKGFHPRALEGIPFLVKDNIKVRGMTVAAGSPAFENLVATEDATCVKALKAAGAIVLGRTNMPAMANGGMQRGTYGRAESPYNPKFLTAAYGSGSSNGSATAVAANFAVFSLGTETVSSGRSPASNNALVAYTPSRGLLPLSGVWPLYPTCDVLVPYTKSMDDMFLLLEILGQACIESQGDFWRQQPFFPLKRPIDVFPPSVHQLKNNNALSGKRLGVPSMYIGGKSPVPITIRPSVLRLWEQARQVLEACGATVVEVDFPLVSEYEDCDLSANQWANIKKMPENWLHTERHELIAHVWDDFLVTNGQADCNTLSCVNPDAIFPLEPSSLAGESEADNQLDWAGLVKYPDTKPASMFHLPGMKEGLKSLEDARKRTLEDWMEKLGLDAVVFPANGDVGPSDADVNSEASRVAWLNGILYSNGNLAIRHLGVPTLSVPMGIMEDTQMPVNITFAGKAYEDNSLLELGYAFEAATHHRQMPLLTPPLDSDMVRCTTMSLRNRLSVPVGELPSQITVTTKSKSIVGETVQVKLKGSVHDTKSLEAANFTCYIDGEACPVCVNDDAWEIQLDRPISDRDSTWTRWTSPALVKTVIVLIYRPSFGLPTGELVLL